MHPVFIQATYYGIVMILTVGILSFVQKGFFWKYFRVRISFGRLILVKLRAVNGDFFAVGRVEEGFLVFKAHKEQKRISIQNKNAFYRSLAVTWIDVDDEKGAILNSGAASVPGFDAVKYNSLYLRALYRPALTDNKEKIMMALMVGIGIAVVICVVLQWQAYSHILSIAQRISRGVVTPGAI